MKLICLLFCLLLFSSSKQETYRAAVVEYYPVQDSSLSPDQRTNANVDNYLKVLEGRNGELDIIIFPESTITTGAFETRENLLLLSTLVPSPEEKVIPCDLENVYPAFARKLSCGAKTAQSYVIANIIEKAPCIGKSCAIDSWSIFNTDVAFDRNGTVVASYRKYHLFGEPGFNTTQRAQVVTFETDFGVTFGMFTCFDILFEDPALLQTRSGTKHIIFPTMWFSELPFLTALQTQAMWSVENNVVLLSAGANNPKRGSGGSGIFQGRIGALEEDIIAEGGTGMYTHEVLKSWDGHLGKAIGNSEAEIDEISEKLDHFYFLLDNLKPYTSVPLNTSSMETKVCHGEFCCEFHVRISGNLKEEGSRYHYRLFAFSGTRTFSGVYYGGVDICAVVFCQNSLAESCGKRFPKYRDISWPITFDEIVVRAKFNGGSHTVQFPNTLLSHMRPLSPEDYEWKDRVVEDESERTIELLKPQKRLFTFGIYGRDFSRDSANSASCLVTSGILLVVVLLKVII